MAKAKSTHLEYFFNSMEFIGILLVLAIAIVMQFFYHENPCPLCMLQRAGFLLVALGLIMNLRFGMHPNHYAIIILSAIYASFVSLRQIALNLTSPNGGFGSPFLGLHLYTWVFIIAMIIVIVTTLIMSLSRQYKKLDYNQQHMKLLLKIGLLFVFTIIVINIYTVIKLKYMA